MLILTPENKQRILLVHNRKLQKCKAEDIMSYHNANDPYHKGDLQTHCINFGFQCCDIFLHKLNIRFLRHVIRSDGMNRLYRGFRLLLREACGRQFSRFCQRIDRDISHAIPFNINDDYIFTTSSFRVQALALTAIILLMSLPAQTFAQTQDTLGIDCDKPRLTESGKLIFGDDGSHRALCEADRRTALTYVGLVTETRDRLRQALTVLPPPLWDHLAQHLRTQNTLNDWRYTDANILTQLQTTSPTVHAISSYWVDGILHDSTIDASWHRFVKARACGTGRQAVILIWLDPTVIRDRWTPGMVQRTVRAWKAKTEAQYAFDESIPRVVTTARQLQRSDGRLEDISSDSTVVTCFSAVPTGALAFTLSLRFKTKFGTILEACTGANEIGVRKLSWMRRNSVYIVPPDAITDAGDPHPDRGEPLLGQSAALPSVNDSNVADGAFLTSSSCRQPRTLDAVRTADCPATVAGQAVQGKHVRTFRFREVQDDPVDEFRIDLVPVRPGTSDLGVIIPPGEPHAVWDETTLFCNPGTIPPSDAPPIPDREADDWGYPRCTAAHGGRFNLGDRYGYVQTVTYPPGWPVDEMEVRHIDDDCFRLDWVTGTQYRPGPACPAGYTGAIIEARNLQWQDRQWAVSDNEHKSAWNRRLSDISNPTEAGTVYDASGTGLDRVVLVRDWYVVMTNCAAPVAASDTQTRDGGACPAGEVGAITEGRSFSWYNPGTPTPACGTLPEAGRLLCTSVSAQQSPVPVSRSVDAAAAAYDAGPTSTSWWDAVTLSRDWHEISNTCTPPSESEEGYTDNDNDGVSVGIDSDDSDPSVGNENGNTDY